MTDTSTIRTDSAEPDDALEAVDDVVAPPPPTEPAEESGTLPKQAKPLSFGAVARRGLRVFAAVAFAFVLFALLFSGLAQARTQTGLQRRFRAELASNAAPVGGAIPKGAPIAIVQSRDIGLDEVVVEGSRSAQLRSGPGHVVGTPLPGQPGNAVLAGRRTMYSGPFRHIGSLHTGDTIRITTGEGNATYRVSNIEHLDASNGGFVQDHGDNRLTLFTADSPWTASGRLVVTATLVGAPLPATRLSHTLDADGLGLTGERNAVPYLLVWLEILAAAALFAVYAASRWSPARTWLVFAPVLALALWLFFESAVRLLPATL